MLAWIDDLALMLRIRDRISDAELRQHVDNQLESARKVDARIAKEGA